ncbi:hypothetical protein NE237_030204 [Protea cynaroides]|uniref:CSC1/OSCA1-like cytosolic domain-containing protein n=1 Tax=Protea cynaroides TaxID=273540 RepID=A0A9Q0JVU4_9MAGN|nr:hypothetical protein NE237_030204 [Protea cynaroides]
MITFSILVQISDGIGADKRPTRKKGFLGLRGERVDAIESYKQNIKEHDKRVALEREKILKDPKLIMPVAFVSFNLRWAAAVCAQTEQSKNPTLCFCFGILLHDTNCFCAITCKSRGPREGCSLAQASDRSVVVRNVPRVSGHSISENVDQFFQTYHPDHYPSHQAVYNANKFARLVRQRERLQYWLDYNQLKFERHPDKRPTRKVNLKTSSRLKRLSSNQIKTSVIDKLCFTLPQSFRHPIQESKEINCH